MYDVTAIKNYIRFLKKEHNLSVTLHINGDEGLAVSGELITFNIHDNSYCAYIKTNPDAWAHCIEKQDKVLKKCSSGAFEGVCYAGVKEYVYPIFKNDKPIGFICVSGYKCPECKSYISRISDKYAMPKENLGAVYNSLKADPGREQIDVLVAPLSNMLELAFIKSVVRSDDEMDIVEKVERYLKLHRNQDITSKDLCGHFSCSRSHISHQFKNDTGKSIREYITELRLTDAKSLLLHSELSVTEIAFSVGFSSSNYFANVFKAEYGVSPRAYRKAEREKRK